MMSKRLLEKTFLLIMFISFVFVSHAVAETNVKIAIFPFPTLADKANRQIGDKIGQMIADKLQKEGAKTEFIKDYSDKEEWDYKRFREEGIKLGVDYIIIGSVFIAGERISIDSTMVNIYEKEEYLTFYSESPNMETLYSAIDQIGKEILSEVFEKKIVANISVKGNTRIEADAIQRVIDIKVGDIVKAGALSKDLRAIYKMGYFDDVVIKKEVLDKGVEIIFEVKEKPTVRKIVFKKNDVYEDEELFEVVDTSTGSILNIYKLNEDVDKLKTLYTEKNYHNCVIKYKVEPVKNRQADIVFTFEEGERIKVEKITFEGNEYFSAKELRKVMQTQEKGLFSFFTMSGDLKDTELDNDVIRIESLYKNNGFSDTKVSDPQVIIGEELITIHFKINEGDQFKISKVDLVGDLIVSKEELLNEMELEESALYSRELIRKGMMSLTDFYSGKGFANVDVNPLIKKNKEEKLIEVVFEIHKGEPVYFDRIIITGNTKTRDKVIRREIKVTEQSLFSKKDVQRSFRNLRRLDYFESIDVKPVQTDEKNKMNLEVNVKEKSTGNFAFGGGYSDGDGVFGQVSVQEKNLFGRGQSIKLSGKISGVTGLYDLSFVEPWLFDIPLSAGADVYKLEKEYDYYDRNSLGLRLKSGYKIFDYTTLGIIYHLEDFEVEDVKTDHTSVTQGDFLNSSIEPYIKYDSRNHFFIPTEGMMHKFSVEYAGEFLGGDIDFTKFLLESGIYIPLFWKFTGVLHAEGGYLDDRTNGYPDIDYERFYLGGINSIRGFDDTDINVSHGGSIQRGGEKFIQFNAELTFPIEEDMGVIGVLFYDQGDVYKDGQSFDLGNQFSSFGAGIRWNSPMGPVRLEYGIVIEGKEVKDTGDGQFEFSVGAFF